MTLRIDEGTRQVREFVCGCCDTATERTWAHIRTGDATEAATSRAATTTTACTRSGSTRSWAAGAATTSTTTSPSAAGSGRWPARGRPRRSSTVVRSRGQPDLRPQAQPRGGPRPSPARRVLADGRPDPGAGRPGAPPSGRR
ncbi:hypothetical protein V2I01_08010 [Micromonospora sp. BRA006-A]|nr:hypothetical protein [Micromonospora sp. BRA006-A]